MKNYFEKVITYHKSNLVLYLLLILIISFWYYFNIPTPLSLILGDFPYWSKGLTRATVSLFNLNFTEAYKQNPLIFLVIIILFIYIFIAPVYTKNRN